MYNILENIRKILIVLASLLAVFSDLHAESSSLLGFWPLDEGKGTTIFDKSGNGNNGSLIGTNWVTGEKSSVLNFSNGKYVLIPHQEYLNVKKTFTICMWINMSNTSGESCFLSKGRGGDFSGYDFFQVDGKLALSMATTVKPGIGIAKAGYRFYTKPVLKENTWAFVAVSYDSSKEKVCFYHNGDIVQEFTAAGEIIYAASGFYEKWDYPHLPISLGTMAICPGHYMLLNGILRDVKIFGTALSRQDILSEYSMGENNTSIHFETAKEAFEKTLTSSITGCVYDAESGEPLNSKVHISSNNISYSPENTVAYSNGFFPDAGFHLKVPASELEVIVTKGLEYQPVKLQIKTVRGKEFKLNLKLKRLFNMPARGWYCGEHHIHALGHGKWPRDKIFGNDHKTAEAGFIKASEVCRGAGLNFVNFVTSYEWKIGPMYSDIAKYSDFIGYSGCEWTPPTGGHVCQISRPPHNNKGLDKGIFSDIDLLDYLEANNAIGVFTHPYSGKISDTSANCVARELPLGIALGKVRIWDVLSWGDLEHAIEDWYRFLNCGFKVAASAGSDAYLNQEAPSLKRAYCKLDSLSWGEVVKSYRKGKTFVTDGPLLIFTVNEKDIGDIIHIPAQKQSRVNLHLEAFSIAGLKKIDIIKNGKIIKEFQVTGSEFAHDSEIEITESCWLATRIYGGKNTFCGGFAHSSPIYIQFGNEGIVAKEDDINYFVNWLETYKNVLPKFAEKYNADIRDANTLHKRIDQAIDIYMSLKKQPRIWEKE